MTGSRAERHVDEASVILKNLKSRLYPLFERKESSPHLIILHAPKVLSRVKLSVGQLLWRALQVFR